MVKKLIFLLLVGIGYNSYGQTNFTVLFYDQIGFTNVGFDDPTSLTTLRNNGDITQAQFDFHNGTNNTLGAIRRATAREVLKYIENSIDMGSTVLRANFNSSYTSGTNSIGVAAVSYTLNGGINEPLALNHIQTGIDPNTSLPDLEITLDFGYPFNSDYSITDASTADLYTVILHEYTHALGISGSIYQGFNSSTYQHIYNDNGPFNSWDMLLKVNDGGTWEDVVVSGALNSDATLTTTVDRHIYYYSSGLNQYFPITSVYPPSEGTTYSHFERGSRGLNFVMSPSGTSNTIIRKWNDVELLALCDLGYSLHGTASTYPFGCSLPPIGVEDNFTYSASGWQSYDVLGNDIEIGSNGLEPDLDYEGTGFLIYNNETVGDVRWRNGELELLPDDDFCGTLTLVYIPKDATTGRPGVPAFVYINVPCTTCPDNPCSYICNGEFENGMGLPLYDLLPNFKDFDGISPPQQAPASFWWETTSSADLIVDGTVRVPHAIGQWGHPGTHNGSGDNDRFIRLYSHRYGSGSPAVGEAMVTQSLPLNGSNQYELSFKAFTQHNSLSSSTIGIYRSPNYHTVPSLTSLNAKIGNGDLIHIGDIDINQSEYNQWADVALSFSSVTGSQYIYFIPINNTSSGGSQSTYLDAVELVEVGPKLEVTVTPDNSAPFTGSNVEFVIQITNAGSINATNVAVQNLLPAEMTYVTSDFNNIVGSTYGHTFSSIPVGSVETIHITGYVTPSAFDCDAIQNTFKILSAVPSIGCNKFEYKEWIQPQVLCGCDSISDSCACLALDTNITKLSGDTIIIPCGDSVFVSAGLGFKTYLWSAGGTTPGIWVSQPGIVSLKVTTHNGCDTTIQFVVETNCCEVSSVSQSFEKEYYSNKYGILTQAIIKNPSNDLYIIIGTSYDKTVGNGQPMTGRGLTLIGVDLLGEQQWIKKYTVADLAPSIYDYQVILYDQISMRIQDAKAGPNTFLITGSTFNANYDWESFVGHFAYDGSLITLKEYRNAAGHLVLNSIDDAYDANGLPDGYLITGTKHSSSSYEIIFGKFDNSGSVVWDQAISFPSVYTAYSHGVESCPNLNVTTSALDGYIIAGIHGYATSTALDKSLVLMKSDAGGYVTQIVRLHQAFEPGSDFKLLPTTTNGGLDRAFLFMYGSGSSTQEIIRVIKFDQNFNIIWSYEYEATSGYDFEHAYDILEEAGEYKIIARNTQGKGALFNIDQSGIPTSSDYKYTGLDFRGGSYFDDFYIEAYNDRMLVEGGNFVSAGIGSNTGATLIRWDANDETSCTHPNPMSHQGYTPAMSPETDQYQQHAGLIPYLVDAPSATISSNVYCCDNNLSTQVESGCYFIPDFDFDLGCDKVTITETSIFGVMSGTPTYQWVLDGNNDATVELPTITGLAQGSHTLCLTMTYFSGCSKTVCKDFTLAPDTVYDTLRACDEFITYQPANCSLYNSYILVDHDPSDDGMGFNYNYNSLNGGPGCSGWTNHDLKHGHYTFNFFNDDNCLEKVLELDIILSDHDTIIECDTIWTCKTNNWYMPDSCGQYYSYEIFDQDPSDDLWHDYNYNSLTNPTYGGPGCAGWISHNFILGNYVINFYDSLGCTRKILKIAVLSKDTVRTTKDIYVCPGQCATIDITDPDYFCQPNYGSFYGTIDDGSLMYPVPSSLQIQICAPTTGTFEFITHTATGCVCIVTGNIIYYSPCPLPSGPAEEYSGIDDAQGGEIEVYPNPTTGLLQLEFGGEIEKGATLTVTDVVGREFATTPLAPTQRIDLSEMASGTYILRVCNGRKTSYKRVVKE